MYAQHGYAPKRSRSVGIGGALIVGAGIMGAMTLIAPKILPKERVTDLEGYNVPVEKPRPPERVKPKPKTASQPTDDKIFIPDPIYKADTSTTIDSTKVMPPALPVNPIVVPPGPPIVEAPPQPPLAFRPAETDPRYAGAFQPQYPSQEIREGREGRVSVRVLIGTDGRVREVEQISATSSAFFEATKRQALAKWRFRPATRGGTPEESWKTLSVKFVLDNGG